MVQLSGILSSFGAASNALTQNQLIMTQTDGDANVLKNNIFTAFESGYYIVCGNIVAKTATVGLNLTSQAHISIVLLHNTMEYHSSCVGRPTQESGSTNLAEATLLQCCFLKAGETLTFKWINYSSIAANVADGIFSIAQIVPIASVAGTLTSASVAVGATTKYRLTMTATQNTIAIANNSFTCKSKGLYLVTGFMRCPATATAIRHALVVRLNSSDFYEEEFTDATSPFEAYKNFSKLFTANSGDVFTFYFVNGSTGAVAPSSGVFTIVKL